MEKPSSPNLLFGSTQEKKCKTIKKENISKARTNLKSLSFSGDTWKVLGEGIGRGSEVV